MNRASKCLVLHHLAALTVTAPAASAARNKHKDRSDEGQDGSDQSNVDGGAVVGGAATIVDLVTDESEEDKVDNHSDGVDDESDSRGERSEDGDDGVAGRQAQQEGDEEHDGADRVQDQDAGKSLSGVGPGRAEVGIVNCLQDRCGIITDLGIRAFRTKGRLVDSHIRQHRAATTYFCPSDTQ